MISKTEIWKSHPDIPGIEVSTFGRVRTLDRVVSSEKRTRFTKGHVLKQHDNTHGYLNVCIPIDGKGTMKYVHRLVAQTFIQNPNNLPEINHKNCDKYDNRVSNLEWCTSSYNSQYREKYGISQTESSGHPLFAINLTTLKVSRFRSQSEASRSLGFFQESINAVVNGKQKQTHGYWFVNDDENASDAIKRKLEEAYNFERTLPRIIELRPRN